MSTSTFSPPLRAYLTKEDNKKIIVLAHNYDEKGSATYTVVLHGEGAYQGTSRVVPIQAVKFVAFFWPEFDPEFDVSDDPQVPNTIGVAE